MDEAERLCKSALAIDPRHLRSQHMLGILCMGNGQIDAAVGAFKKVIKLDPGVPEAHNNLSLAMQMLGRFEEAAISSSRALELKPDLAEAHNNLGLALQNLGRHREAVGHFKDALASKQDPAFLRNLGISLRALRRHREALASFDAAIARTPHDASLHRYRGIVLLTLGEIEPASRAFEQAIRLDPHDAASYRNLVEARPASKDDPWLARMEVLAAQKDSLPPSSQIELDFALGKALANCGEHERSFRHYLAGNASMRLRISYDEPATLGFFERVREAADAAFVERNRGAGDPSPVPIFIVGMPRSGTTLLEQMLAAHPDVATVGERADFSDAVERLLGAGGRRDEFVERLAGASADQFREAGAAYLAAIRPFAPSAGRIVDKTPGNSRFAGLIHAALPNAHIIHIRRNPVDTCLSCFAQFFEEGQLSFAYDLGELGRYWKSYDGLMAHWRSILPEGAMLEVQYEELVNDFEGQARRILAYCGLPWSSDCLEFYRTRRPIETASWVQARQPVYRSSVERWRPAPELLKPLLDALQL